MKQFLFSKQVKKNTHFNILIQYMSSSTDGKYSNSLGNCKNNFVVGLKKSKKNEIELLTCPFPFDDVQKTLKLTDLQSDRKLKT
jgi:hypothetical protein